MSSPSLFPSSLFLSLFSGRPAGERGRGEETAVGDAVATVAGDAAAVTREKGKQR